MLRTSTSKNICMLVAKVPIMNYSKESAEMLSEDALRFVSNSLCSKLNRSDLINELRELDMLRLI